MTTYNVDVGDSVTPSADAVASKPNWLSFTSASTLGGLAQLPSGFRRLVASSPRRRDDYYVNPITLPSTDMDWRVAIIAPNGAYITSTGKGDIPTVGTPIVRLSVNAPSKAVVRFPVLKNTPNNILDTSFSGWSDGSAGAVRRGLELTVEYRDRASGLMVMAFRGMIYQVESGDVVTVTAYDRLMDLAQYSDQYQSHAGYDQDAESTSRTVSGTDYIYTFNNNVGTLLTATNIDKLKIDATSAMTGGDGGYTPPASYIIHPLPAVSGYTPQEGRKITKVKAHFHSYITVNRGSNSAPLSCTIDVFIPFYLFHWNGTAFEQVYSYTGVSYQYASKSSLGDVTIETSYDKEVTVNWSITDDPSNYFIGVGGIYCSVGTVGWLLRSNKTYASYSSSRLTVTGTYYGSNDGTSWTQLTVTTLPEIAIEFEHTGANATVSSFTISGNQITIAQGNVPGGPSIGYLSTVDAGIGYIISYFISGAAGIQGIVKDLIEWAGLTQDVAVADMGQTTYYTSSTYDYLTCIQELLKSGNYGIMASINKAGKIYVKSRHTTTEVAVAEFTTAPDGNGEQSVVSHDLTAHWMAEKATQAYIAENVTISGLPIALETDDALMPNSLTYVMQSPLRSVITDTTLGTHDLMANAAGGKMVQLHTNVFEGKMVLAGYRLDIWDFTMQYCGGLPIDIDVPEYGAQGTAIPTEIILGDGVTQVSLDNIRTAERNEMANSMSMTNDAISNNASSIPNSVYIFARLNTYEVRNGITVGAVTSVDLLDSDGVSHSQTNSTYIKTVKDNAGYTHVCAVFRAEDVPGGYAPVKPVERVAVTWGGVQRIAVFDNPKYAYGGQNVHVDIRIKSA